VSEQTDPAVDVTWLVNDLVERVAHTEHAVVLSADGLLIGGSDGLNREDAEHLSAVASGLNGLARGAGRRFGGGAVRQTLIEMESGFLFVTAGGHGACVAVVGDADADVGLVAYEMAMLVTRVGTFLTSPARVHARVAGDT
jgi:predicted regulator of Ras-like GTPase activity (Roadblock/LC7/MglB family)